MCDKNNPMQKESKKAVAKRVRQHTERQRRTGLRRVTVWIPETDTERLKDIAAYLRSKAGLQMPTDGKPQPKRIEIPIIEPRHQPSGTTFLEIGPEELGLHMLLRANGGVWHGQRKIWEVPICLPGRLGLESRVRTSV